MTHPNGSFGNNLKIWYYFVLGFDVGGCGATIGGGMIILLPGRIVFNGFITGMVGA